MNIPTDLKYTENDEWIRVEGSTGTIGITDYAQDQLSDVVFVEIIAEPRYSSETWRCLCRSRISKSRSRGLFTCRWDRNRGQ